MGPIPLSVRGDELMLHHALANCASADDTHPPNRRASSEDELRRRRQRVLVESCAHAIIEIARCGVEDMVGAAAGDTMPRIEEASAACNLIRGGDEKLAAPSHQPIRRVDQGRPRTHDCIFRRAIDAPLGPGQGAPHLETSLCSRSGSHRLSWAPSTWP